MEKILMIGLVFLMLTGCGASISNDPHDGGLIGGIKGLTTGAYKERIEERKKNLDALDQENRRLQGESEKLEDVRAKFQADLDRQHKMLSSLEGEVEALQDTMSRYEAQTAEKEAKRLEVEGEIQTLKNEIVSIRRNTQLGIQEREEKIKLLQKDLDALLDISALL